MKQKLFDVVVYQISSGEITNIVGKNLKKNSGYFNAERRVETVLNRMNKYYNAEIVPAGKYKVGDFLPQK